MAKRKSNKKSAQPKNKKTKNKCAKTSPEAPIALSDPTDVGGHRQVPAWNIIIKKLDFQSQMKISQQNQQLEALVRENAESELQKLRRHIKDNKYIARQSSNPENWAIYRALIWIFEDLDVKIRTISQKPKQSPIAILAKAEVLAAKLNAERWSDESGHLWSEEFDLDEWKPNQSFGTIKIGNKDWKLKIVDGEKSYDGQKLSICELATGKKNFEEWNFLPKNWNHHLGEKMIVLEDNFIALIFDDHMFRPYGTSWNLEGHGRGDLLILNLASRKKFWMKRSQIENQMKAKVYEEGGDGAQYDYDELRVDDSLIDEMTVGKHEIEIKYKLDYRYGGGFLTLESFIELKLEEGDIYDFEMVSAKFNTDEHLNELLDVDRHMDHHPGRLWMDDDDGWYDDSDEENDSDDSEESWDDPNRKVQIPDKDGRDGKNGTDDDNGWVTEEEEIEFS